MILVDHQIADLCRGVVPDELRFFYSSIWTEIPRHCRPMVEPFDPSLVNPASLDIRIGDSAMLREGNGLVKSFMCFLGNIAVKINNLISPHKIPKILPRKYKSVDLFGYSESDPYWMQPGDRLLVASLETINLPNFLTAQFRLKSSRGREWYEHMEAGFCDPGWHGSKLTMEIINMDCEPLPIYPGLKMGQLIFSLTLGIPDKDYSVTGRYNGDRQVESSKG